MNHTWIAGLALFLLWTASLAGQGFSPEEAVKRMRVAEGLEVKLVACEPMIRQPISLSFDERGRLWVLQYLQYPTPMGLKPVAVDRYLRIQWDKLPEPPPRGPKGADRITILSDPDENGRFRSAKDFVADMNLASGFCLGRGGVWVVQPPYLLFYADRNQDDIPDGPPEVHLSGFGMEDSHAFANSLQWGPDGWLYGAQGSTVTARIVNPAEPNSQPIEFQQGIWRYHPSSRRFELFAEGGGNTWGLDFDKHGNLIAGTNYGHSVGLHMVQGGYYVKGFGKHGPLHNPYAYGYFEHMPYAGKVGGHVTCGGIVYQADALGEIYRDQYIACNLLDNAIRWHRLRPHSSTRRSEPGGEILAANDTWFRPVDLITGPDGAIYVADWYDRRANHVDPVDTWDRSNGRIYRIQPKGMPQFAAFDLRQKSNAELIDLLRHPNNWYSREAQRLLIERDSPTLNKELRAAYYAPKSRNGLQVFWTLAARAPKETALAAELWRDRDHPRLWAARLVGDWGMDVRILAESRFWRPGASPAQRSQLASTLGRLKGREVVALLVRLAEISEADDPYIPLQTWWALEAQFAGNTADVVALFRTTKNWDVPIIRQVWAERVARRLGECNDFVNLATLWDSAPPTGQTFVMAGLSQSLEGRRLPAVPPALEPLLAKLIQDKPFELATIRLAAHLGHEPTLVRIRERLREPSDPARSALAELAGRVRLSAAIPELLAIVEGETPEALRGQAIDALASFADERIAADLMRVYSKLNPSHKAKVRNAMLSRPTWGLPLLRAVEAGTLSAKDIDTTQLSRLVGQNAEMDRLIAKLFGQIGPQSPGDKQARIHGINVTLSRQGLGDAGRGRELFRQHCSTCHQLFGEGQKLGPDLTGTDRHNRLWLVTQIVDPSLAIRPEYMTFSLATKDGRSLTGLLVEQSGQTVTLADAKNSRTTINREQIEALEPSPQSLMPEKILDQLNEAQICDLFAFLMAKQPPAAAGQGAAKPLQVCLISGSLEYRSDESLTAWQKFAEANYAIECSRAFRKKDDDLPGLENLETCDVAVFYTRRLTVDGEQLARVKKYVEAGKPIVAIRTASHGFQKYLEFDKLVLGGNYKNHYKAGPTTTITFTPQGAMHPILRDVKLTQSVASLYRNTGLAEDAQLLMTGQMPGSDSEPLTWTRLYKGGRVFYTSLGHPEDFRDENFLRMIAQAVFWTANREVQKKVK